MRRMLALVGLLVAGIIGLAEPSAAQRVAERAQGTLTSVIKRCRFLETENPMVRVSSENCSIF